MADIKIEPDTTPQTIFHLVGTTLSRQYGEDFKQCEDVEDQKFMEVFSPEYKPWWITLYESSVSVSPGNSSPKSDDSGVGLSPHGMQVKAEEDDLSVVLDDADLAMVCDFFTDRDDEETGTSPEFAVLGPSEGLNLPLLPKLGVEPDVSVAPVRSDGSCGDYECDTDMGSDDSDSEYTPPNRKGCKNVLLWKFLLNSLANSEHIGEIVQWEDRYRGIFKFVDTVRISQLWGSQKKKPDMNFEKLSRGIRHYYRGGLMSRVEGRRLVYRFNWKKVPRCYRQKR